MWRRALQQQTRKKWQTTTASDYVISARNHCQSTVCTRTLCFNNFFNCYNLADNATIVIVATDIIAPHIFMLRYFTYLQFMHAFCPVGLLSFFISVCQTQAHLYQKYEHCCYCCIIFWRRACQSH